MGIGGRTRRTITRPGRASLNLIEIACAGQASTHLPHFEHSGMRRECGSSCSGARIHARMAIDAALAQAVALVDARFQSGVRVRDKRDQRRDGGIFCCTTFSETPLRTAESPGNATSAQLGSLKWNRFHTPISVGEREPHRADEAKHGKAEHGRRDQRAREHRMARIDLHAIALAADGRQRAARRRSSRKHWSQRSRLLAARAAISPGCRPVLQSLPNPRRRIVRHRGLLRRRRPLRARRRRRLQLRSPRPRQRPSRHRQNPLPQSQRRASLYYSARKNFRKPRHGHIHEQNALPTSTTATTTKASSTIGCSMNSFAPNSARARPAGRWPQFGRFRAPTAYWCPRGMPDQPARTQPRQAPPRYVPPRNARASSQRDGRQGYPSGRKGSAPDSRGDKRRVARFGTSAPIPLQEASPLSATDASGAMTCIVSSFNRFLATRLVVVERHIASVLSSLVFGTVPLRKMSHSSR